MGGGGAWRWEWGSTIRKRWPVGGAFWNVATKGDETKGMGGSYLEKVHLTTILCAFQTLDLKVNW